MLKELAAVIALALITYPAMRSGGWLDQWFGLWWLAAVPVVTLGAVMAASAWRRRVGGRASRAHPLQSPHPGAGTSA